MKDPLIFIASSGLGENLMATPLMEWLSRRYRIYLVMKANIAPLFARYDFLHEVIGLRHFEPGDPGFFLPKNISEKFQNDKVGYFTSHFDYNERVISQDPTLRERFKALPKLPTPVPAFSTSRNLLHRFGIGADESKLFDFSLRRPTSPNRSRSLHFSLKSWIRRLIKKPVIVLYEGSNESLRRLPSTAYNHLQKILLPYQYAGFEIVAIYSKKMRASVEVLPDFRYVETTGEPESLLHVLGLFEAGVRLMIGPDSGLTNLAHCFRIPQIWIETRERIEMIIDKEHYREITLFRVKNPSCLRECRAMKHIEKFGPTPMEYSPKVENAVADVVKLHCYQMKNATPPCLNFSDFDLKLISTAIEKNLTNGKTIP